MLWRLLIVLVFGGDMAFDWAAIERIVNDTSHENHAEVKGAFDVISSYFPEPIEETRFGQDIESKEAAFIMAHEGYSDTVYWDRPLSDVTGNKEDEDKAADDKARLTVGFGNTSHGLNWGDTIDDETGVQFLLADIRKHKNILFTELALDTAMLRKGVHESDLAKDYKAKYGEGWQYDYSHDDSDGVQYDKNLPAGVTKPYIEKDKYDHGFIYGFENEEEMVAAGQKIYEQLDENTRIAALSVTFNMGSATPDFLNTLTEAAQTGNSKPVADYLKNNMSYWEKNNPIVYEGLRKRRLDEANLIETGSSSQVASHATSGVLKDFGVGNPFDGGKVPFMANRLPRSGGGGGQLPSSVGGFDVGQQMMAEQSTRTSRVGYNPNEFGGIQNTIHAGRTRTVPSQYPEEDAVAQNRTRMFLEEQYGSFGFFIYENDATLQVGVDEYGNLVPIDDESMETSISILDAIDDEDLVGTTEVGLERIKTLLSWTEWGSINTKHQQQFDVKYGDLRSEAEQREFLSDAIENIENSLQFLGLTTIDETGVLSYELTPEEILMLAKDIERLNKTEDIGFVNGMVKGQAEQKNVVNEYNMFQTLLSQNKAAASNYFVKVKDETVNQWSEDIFVGNRDSGEWLEFLKQQAYANYPHLKEILSELGMTPKEYFASTEASIEDLLGKQVNLADAKWSPILNYTDPNTGEVRAANQWETENWVRGLPEYLDSNKGQNKIYQLIEGVASAFGKAAW